MKKIIITLALSIHGILGNTQNLVPRIVNGVIVEYVIPTLYPETGYNLNMPPQGLANGTNDINGSTFTLPSAGKWKITVTATISNTNLNQNGSVLLYTSDNIQVPNFKLSMMSYSSSYSAYQQITASVVVTIASSTSYKLKSHYGSGSGLLENGWATTTSDSISSIFWEKISN